VLAVAMTLSAGAGFALTGGGIGLDVLGSVLAWLAASCFVAAGFNAIVYPPHHHLYHYRPLEPIEYRGPGSFSPFVAAPDRKPWWEHD